MKVLLTGASGFVGSHVLDSLRARGITAAVLLRPSSSRRHLEEHLPGLDIRIGSIGEPQTLAGALAGVTHVIHCAGSTKALREADFFEVNQAGTRRVVEAINQQGGRIQRLVHLSSLAAGGPAPPGRPAREEDPPAPVSAYGRSKLAGEEEVRHACRSDYVILRPPAVYGPRDAEFLRLFKAVKWHVLPRPSRQPLSLVFAKDLAEVAASCLTHPAAAGKTFYVASPEVTTARALAGEIASQTGTWALPVPLPLAALWLLSCLMDIAARVTRRPNVVSLQKFAELRAPGWVCDSSRLRREVGLSCETRLKGGIAGTLAWYRRHGWI
jgi:nucleoside-diphosphate-sugar epimerase